MNDRERTFHLSPVQVVASALASITAAVLASFFGVAGTIIGAGVVSAAASIGNALYSYSIRSTRKALRQSLPSAFKETVPSALKQPAATVRSLVTSGARVAGDPSGGTGANGDGAGAGADPDNTNEVPDLDGSWVVPPPAPPGRPGPPPILSNRGLGAPPPPSGVPGTTKPRDLGAGVEAWWSGLLRLVRSLRWRNIALATVAAFGLSMAAVTGVEALANKPLSGIVGGSAPAGATTSLGGLVSGQSSKPSPTAPSTPSTSTTTNPQTTNPNSSSTSTTSPSSSSSTTPSTTTTTPPSPTSPSTPSGPNGSTPGTSGSSSGATSSGSSSSGASAAGTSSSGAVSGTQPAGG